MRRGTWRWLAAGSALFASSACGDASTETTPNSAQSFIASAASFEDFCSWKSAPATTPTDASDGLHGLGPLTVYWNQSPPHGATKFPVGTIIVKGNQDPDPTKRVLFAMVKRADNFNSSGAVGWEWYSLQQQAADCSAVTILWGNVTPPAGETYANMPVGDCNGCHEAAGNDGVWDSALQLTNF
jgi:hypothetical protein